MKKYDNEWKIDPSHLKNGRTCPNCKKLKKLEQNKQNFIERAAKIHNNKYIYDKVIYNKQHDKVTIICPIHGEFTQTPQAHLRGQGCPLCAGNNFLRNTDYFISLAKKVHGDKYDYSLVDYKHCKQKVRIKCNKCGHIFEQTPDSHLQGQGCSKCILKSQTKLYDKLKESLPNIEILFEVNNKVVSWLEDQRFDIYFPKYNIAVEYNGIQHYIPIEHFGGKVQFNHRLELDALKRRKCLEHNCTLFELKYNYTSDDYDNLIKQIQNIIYDKIYS